MAERAAVCWEGARLRVGSTKGDDRTEEVEIIDTAFYRSRINNSLWLAVRPDGSLVLINAVDRDEPFVSAMNYLVAYV